MSGMFHKLIAGVVVAGGMVLTSGAGAQEVENDYPTVTRADYIFGCMQVNGQTRDALEKCSCSIDIIAGVLPYKKYEEAETIMSVRLKGGEKTAFLFTPQMREKVNELKRAQIEGELRCF